MGIKMGSSFRDINCKNLDRQKAKLFLLVLASQNIEAKMIPMSGTQNHHPENKTWARIKSPKRYKILVPENQTSLACSHIALYEKENRFFPSTKIHSEIQFSSFYALPALIIMAILSCIHLAFLSHAVHGEMVFRFGASSFFIRQGDTFRAITALFFHSNGQHLVGNLGGTMIFMAPLIRLAGYGLGPFLILAAATLGNLITAWLHMDARLSIGASTAVMGAAGLLAARQATGHSRFKGLVPLAAGATLMALFSQGENTDVSAHFFGFASGFSIGLLFFPLHRVWQFSHTNPLALALTLLITGTAFFLGV